jgi:hypothetical protein
MRNIIAGILMGILLICAMKQCIDRAEQPRAVTSLQKFRSFDEAAMYGARRAVQCSEVYECGGHIFRTPKDEYVVGPTHTSFSGDELDGEDYKIPDDWEVVGDFHSHACLAKTHIPEYFSDADADGNTADNTVGVMVDMCTGDVHMFIPGNTPIGKKISFEVHETPGLVFGHVPVSGKSVEPDTGP